jgi:hypothetical protein
MEETPSERRLAENEVLFRQLNEQIHKGYEETNQLALEDNQPEFLVRQKSNDAPKHFFCECADEKCGERVLINVNEYNEIHRHRDRFVILPGHELESIEEVLVKKPGYYVVRKYAVPPSSSGKLNPTPLHNA